MHRKQSNWEVGERNAEDNTITLYGGDGRPIARVTPQSFYDKVHTQEYYARLMVLAPELLAACELVQEAWSVGVDSDMATAVDAVLLVMGKAKQ